MEGMMMPAIDHRMAAIRERLNALSRTRKKKSKRTFHPVKECETLSSLLEIHDLTNDEDFSLFNHHHHHHDQHEQHHYHHHHDYINREDVSSDESIISTEPIPIYQYSQFSSSSSSSAISPEPLASSPSVCRPLACYAGSNGIIAGNIPIIPRSNNKNGTAITGFPSLDNYDITAIGGQQRNHQEGIIVGQPKYHQFERGKYHDHLTYPVRFAEKEERKGSGGITTMLFPERLHDILEAADRHDFADIIVSEINIALERQKERKRRKLV